MLEEEQQEEDEKAARLEALLEQFREPEDLPRAKNSGAVWLMMALIASVAGCWLALEAAKGNLPGAKTPAGAPLKPTKVKDRSEFYAKLRIADVEADYRARCKRGMRAQEVRWILEDFTQAGLTGDAGGLPAEVREAAEVVSQTNGWKEWRDSDTGNSPALSDRAAEVLKEKGLQLARRQQRWYAEALADGLRLDREQKLKAYRSGLELVEDLGADFPRAGEAVELADTGESPPPAEEGRAEEGRAEESSLLTPTLWLQDERSAPWQKCELRADQEAVVDVARSSEGTSSPWYDPERVLIESTEADPASNTVPVETIGAATGVFPLLAEQAQGISGKNLPELVMNLHPAQLRMLLLTRPEMTPALERALAEKDQ